MAVKSRHFHDIYQEAMNKGMTPGRERAARIWMREQGKKLEPGDNPIEWLKSDDWSKYFVRRQILPGFMYTYEYSPKYKDDPKKLPYWDKYPLVFVIEEYDDRFLVINLHYLNRPMRALLMDALHTLTTNKKYNDNQRIAASYGILKSSAKFRWFKPCVKYHLKSHIKTKPYKIPSEDWDTALFAPFEQFQRKPKSYVWQESAKIIAAERRKTGR